MKDKLLNYVEVNECERAIKTEISKHKKIICVCCNGSKVFRNQICKCCDDDGMMFLEDLDLVGIPLFMLN
ncbi:MAG: hypothetical protein ACOCVF_00790 [bacterium]